MWRLGQIKSETISVGMEYMNSLEPTHISDYNFLTRNTKPRQDIAAKPINCTSTILDNDINLLTPRCSLRTTPDNLTWRETDLIHPEMSLLKNAQSFQDIINAALYVPGHSGPPCEGSYWGCTEPLTPPTIATPTLDGKFSMYHQTCQPKMGHPELGMFGFTIT